MISKMLIRSYSHFQYQKWWYEGVYAPGAQVRLRTVRQRNGALLKKHARGYKVACRRTGRFLSRDTEAPAGGQPLIRYPAPINWSLLVTRLAFCKTCCSDSEKALQIARSQSPVIQLINRPIKHKSIHGQSTLPKVIMSPGGPNGEPVVGSDGSRKKGKATPDTLV